MEHPNLSTKRTKTCYLWRTSNISGKLFIKQFKSVTNGEPSITGIPSITEGCLSQKHKFQALKTKSQDPQTDRTNWDSTMPEMGLGF